MELFRYCDDIIICCQYSRDAERITKALKVLLDVSKYLKSIKISNAEFAKINILADKFHAEWNYKIIPQ